MAWMQLASGAALDLSDPQIGIQDIAHSLSMQCRFNGHTAEFYSVAEHSVRAADLLRAVLGRKLIHLGPPDPVAVAWLARVVLLHDAHEAIMGDITRPIEQLLPGVPQLKSRLDAQIYTDFFGSSIMFVASEPVRSVVKEIDQLMLCIEAMELLDPINEQWRDQDRSGTLPWTLAEHLHKNPLATGTSFLRAACMSPETACDMFKSKFDATTRSIAAESVTIDSVSHALLVWTEATKLLSMEARNAGV